MNKKILFFISFLFFSSAVFAQSMSDDQVIKFIKTEQAKGTNQQTIVTQLMRRGVTTQQLQRVRRKYEQQQQQMGAVDAVDRVKDDDRMRYNEERSAFGTENNRYMTTMERREAMNEELREMNVDSVMNTSGTDPYEVFGRNIFNNQYLTFQPNSNMATPQNYRLGAGDKVIIDVWGASQETFSATVSPDGTVVIPGIGPIKIGGLSVGEATSKVRSVLGARYSSSQISLSLGETRSIMVQVMGEVVLPGTYTLSSLSTAFNALYAAGGINDIGTLRDIEVYRNGRVIAHIDVYDYILNGNSAGDVRLQDNDIIRVGTYDCIVSARGRVKRPMYYEMKSSETIGTLIDYAGGFTGDAYKKNVRLIRKSETGYSIHTVEEFDLRGFTLHDGDSLYVDNVLDNFSNLVEIRGAVRHPGQFEMGGPISTVRELINAAEGLRPDAFVTRAVMHRMKVDRTLELLPVDVKGIMDGVVPDIVLKKNDVLYIPSKTDMLGEQTLTISGQVQFPGRYAYADKTTIEDLILQAGGPTAAASFAKVNVYRRITDRNATTANDTITRTYTFSLKDGFVISTDEDAESVFYLHPFDIVVVRKSPAYEAQQNVRVHGSVNFEGEYAMTSKTYKLVDLINDAGGISKEGWAQGARLERVMTEEERFQRSQYLREQQIMLYEQSITETGFNMARADSLLDMRLDLGRTYTVSIDLEQALKNPNSDYNIELRDGDNLYIPQYTGVVRISGEVMRPISVTYQKGETLGYYVDHAGGYADNARKKGVYVVYANGAVMKVNRHSRKAIQPGCEIVIPSKKLKRDKNMTTQEALSMGTSAASIAAMVITVANNLK
ncbi:MAG: SLBB domain-containing protein [Bacteroidales bacterium]|nr:SLBB domain-containing protein [Bacteroidales bacterium]